MSDIITIPDIQNYTFEIKDNVLILTPKYIKKTLQEMYNINLTHSKIDLCVIYNDDKIISEHTKFRSILINIWKSMPTQLLLQNTTYNMKLANDGENGYRWINDINVSVQGKDSHGAFKEMVKMIQVNSYKCNIHITVLTGEKICFEI